MPFKKLSIHALLATLSVVLTACGGSNSNSSVDNDSDHPTFQWAKVAVSNNYSPSGDISDLTPTFSWKATDGATSYNFGHESTDGRGDWKEYTVAAAEAGCATGTTCNYKPADKIFNIGEQKVWWVRGKENNQWKAWSDSHVFNVVDGSGGGNTTTPTTVSPTNGNVVTNNKPTFTWNPIQNAKSLVIGIEKQDGSNWKSFTISSQNTSFTPSNIISDGNYTWWIRAEKQDGSWTNWSNGADFSIDASGTGGGTGLKTLTPTGTINTTQPTFTWTKQSDATDYQIGFESDTDWKEYTVGAISACGPAPECSLKPTGTGLKVGDNTTWYARAKINGSWSDWTDGTNFSVSTPPNSGERPFIIKVDTTIKNYTRDTAYTIPTNNSGSYNYSVDCDSDGNLEATDLKGRYICTYPKPGEYNVSIYGTFPEIGHSMDPNSRQDPKKIIAVVQWGTQVWESLHMAFARCSNLTTIEASDTPNLSNAQSTSGMFMFAEKFNQDISHWDVSNVTDMSQMFRSAKAFNQDLNNWDVSNVTNMSYMFSTTAFNHNIYNWDTSKVTNMSNMFSHAIDFNKNIGNWNTSKVTNMKGMFSRAFKFNQDIGNWNVSNVTDMTSMFSAVYSFNQDIGNWDVSNVTNMGWMFNKNRDFNQQISNWDVSKVTKMTSMFNGATNFDQDLSNWDISNVTDMTSMLKYATLSTANYDRLLLGWSVLNLNPKVINFDAGNSKYSSAAVTARQKLIDDFNWVITDGGLQSIKQHKKPELSSGLVTVNASTGVLGLYPRWYCEIGPSKPAYEIIATKVSTGEKVSFRENQNTLGISRDKWGSCSVKVTGRYPGRMGPGRTLLTLKRGDIVEWKIRAVDNDNFTAKMHKEPSDWGYGSITL